MSSRGMESKGALQAEPLSEPSHDGHVESGDETTGAGRARRAIVRTVGWLHSSSAVRRLVPLPVALGSIEAFAFLSQRRRTSFYLRLEWFYSELLRHTPLAGSEQEVARRAVVERLLGLELHWRPWVMQTGEVAGLEHYHSARQEGRPIVAPFVHFGWPYGQFVIMPKFGIEAWVLASPHHYDESRRGHGGRLARQGRRYVDMLGPGHGIRRPGAFDQALEVLRGGNTVSIAFDIAGSMPTPFLGRVVALASGPSRLALQSDAMVLPMVHQRRGRRPVLRFGPPLDARDYPDDVSLQAAIAEMMETWALESPEAVAPLFEQPGGPPLIHEHPAGALAR
jgi:lauroyl/myristoyl acyltransferase